MFQPLNSRPDGEEDDGYGNTNDPRPKTIVHILFGQHQLYLEESPDIQLIHTPFGDLPQMVGVNHAVHLELVGDEALPIFLDGLGQYLIHRDGTIIRVDPEGHTHVYRSSAGPASSDE